MQPLLAAVSLPTIIYAIKLQLLIKDCYLAAVSLNLLLRKTLRLNIYGCSEYKLSITVASLLRNSLRLNISHVIYHLPVSLTYTEGSANLQVSKTCKKNTTCFAYKLFLWGETYCEIKYMYKRRGM